MAHYEWVYCKKCKKIHRVNTEKVLKHYKYLDFENEKSHPHAKQKIEFYKKIRGK